LVQNTKSGNKTPNGHKIYQMAIKYTGIFHLKTLKIYLNWDYWYASIPSSNPRLE
jgi:hypothetical protein